MREASCLIFSYKLRSFWLFCFNLPTLFHICHLHIQHQQALLNMGAGNTIDPYAPRLNPDPDFDPLAVPDHAYHDDRAEHRTESIIAGSQNRPLASRPPLSSAYQQQSTPFHQRQSTGPYQDQGASVQQSGYPSQPPPFGDPRPSYTSTQGGYPQPSSLYPPSAAPSFPPARPQMGQHPTQPGQSMDQRRFAPSNTTGGPLPTQYQQPSGGSWLQRPADESPSEPGSTTYPPLNPAKRRR
jgi:hypothetical protein